MGFTFRKDIRDAAEAAWNETGEPLAPGRYHVRLEAAEFAEINDKPAWKVQMRCTNKNEVGADRTIWDRIFFTDQAQARAFWFLTAFGYPADKIDEFDETRSMADVLENLAVVEVDLHRYKDKDGNDKVVHQPTYRGYFRADSEFGVKPGAGGSGSASKPRLAPSTSSAPTAGDEDIPF